MVVRKLDVKEAFPQANGFKQDAYMHTPREEQDQNGLGRLLVPAFGLTDLGRLRYLTSPEALAICFGFQRSRFDPSLYINKSDNKQSILVVQVNDYLYTGTKLMFGQFESSSKKELNTGSTESESLGFIGASLDQDRTEATTLDASVKLKGIQPI